LVVVVFEKISDVVHVVSCCENIISGCVNWNSTTTRNSRFQISSLHKRGGVVQRLQQKNSLFNSSLTFNIKQKFNFSLHSRFMGDELDKRLLYQLIVRLIDFSESQATLEKKFSNMKKLLNLNRALNFSFS
jgi:hypothetical protein